MQKRVLRNLEGLEGGDGMITEAILNVFFAVLSGFFTLLPKISWNVEPDSFSTVFEVIRFAGYLLPMGTVYIILSAIISFTIFRITISLIKTIWGLLPFV